ncbi:uncharacterized protein LOC141821504 [Curcuma longa]|uniref:uncharacterized protein LOC141821504 n=1 Tax=Curcuma longa TaxID=136217 RepID=UPI003D9DE003
MPPPSSISSSLSPSDATTIFDLLLPDAVKFVFLDSNGSFSVELDGPCYVDFEYLLYYETRVSGVVKYGGIEDLKGVKVRRFLIWLDVDAIKVYLYFQVGWITRKLGVDQFRTVLPAVGIRSFLDGVEELSDWSLEV